MDASPRRTITVAKLAIVLVVLVALITFVGSGLVPRVPLWQLIIGSVAALLALFVLLLVVVACSASVRQWVLRAGGTDTQWLWFPRDPPGLEKMRGSGERL